MKKTAIFHNLPRLFLVLMVSALMASAENAETATEDRVQVRDVEVVVEQAPAPPVSTTNTSAPKLLPQSFEGKLVRARNRMIFFPPPHPYQLNDLNGNRIAWVNLENAIYTGSIGGYLQKQVIIHGRLRTPNDDSPRNKVLDAKNLRLR